MSEQTNVSHLPVYQRETLHAPRPRPRPQWKAEPAEASRKKFTAKGHDSQLQDAQHGKFPVEIITLNDGSIKGTISRRDKYTITVNLTSGRDKGKDLIIFKHAIESVLIDKGALAQQGE